MAESKGRELDVLLAEDNEADANLTVAALLDATVPNRIHQVWDGEEALAFVRRTGPYTNAPRPDLVLLDLNLPRIDGFKVLAKMKADPDLRKIPVVVITGSENEKDLDRAYELQAAAYIVKPSDLDQYFAAIRSLKHLWNHVLFPPKTLIEN
ncbi:MAG: transcriptional regulator [Bryobacterales bacterium]|jgi:chemotaxis family two-component system response regulator Rcp1|nr:transcriptional regulator [Bryobacterales bacterium]